MTCPPATSRRRVVATASSIRLSWVTRSSVPGYSASACSSCSIAGRSRWLAGSSRTRTLTPRAWSRASSARVRSPGDSVAAARRACSGGVAWGQRRRRAQDVVGGEPDLGQERADVRRRPVGNLGGEGVQELLGTEEAAAGLLDLTDLHGRSE